MSSNPHWRRVRIDAQPDGSRIKLLSAVVHGVRVYLEQHWSAERLEQVRELLAERYYTSDPKRAHRTMDAALAAATEPVEPNDP